MNRIKKFSLFYLMVALCFLLITPVNAAAKSLSSKEKKEYGSILWNKEYQYIVEFGTGGMYGAEFILFDVNNDGRKELLVSGAYGQRNIMTTMIYGYDGRKFHRTGINGEVNGVSPKGISILATNYDDQGQYYYFDTYVYTVDRKCKLTKKFYNKMTTNIQTNKESDKYYNSSGKSISEKSFNSAYKKYKFKTVGNAENTDKPDIYWNSAEDENTILKIFGKSALPKLPDGDYTVINSYGKISGSNYKVKAKVKKKGGEKFSANTYIFELAKNCKYGCLEESNFYSCSKKNFINDYMSIPHMNIHFKLKDGKVVKLYMTPSW